MAFRIYGGNGADLSARAARLVQGGGNFPHLPALGHGPLLAQELDHVQDWYAGDKIDAPGGGLTVEIVANPVGPPTTTVTATASQAVPKLFLRAEVALY